MDERIREDDKATEKKRWNLCGKRKKREHVMRRGAEGRGKKIRRKKQDVLSFIKIAGFDSDTRSQFFFLVCFRLESFYSSVPLTSPTHPPTSFSFH